MTRSHLLIGSDFDFPGTSARTFRCLSRFHEIEETVGVFRGDPFLCADLPTLDASLPDIDMLVLGTIKKEISSTYPNLDDLQRASIDDLPVVAWIRQNWHSERYRDHFLFFAERLLLIRSIRATKKYWTRLQIVFSLLQLDPESWELTRLAAKCLAWMGHHREAEQHFETAASTRDSTTPIICAHRNALPLHGLSLKKCSHIREWRTTAISRECTSDLHGH